MDRRTLDRSLAYVNSWLRWRVPRAGIPGCAVAVALGGRVLMAEGYGRADVERDVALSPDHVFRVASHSKTFTATAVLQLVERGRLALDDPVARHLPWLAEHADARMREVTVRQLLCHGAGILRDGADSDYWQLMNPFPAARRLRAEVMGAELVLDPNVSMKYSNIGYGLLGLLVEELAGTGFEEHTRRNLLEPLGLTSTAAELGPELAARAVTGHGLAGPGGTRRPVPSPTTGVLAAATGFASTPSDLCTFFSALCPGSRKLLSDASKREMQRVHFRVHRPGPGLDEDYGLGLSLLKVGERRTFGHSGGFPGQTTRTIADPADGLVVSVLTNCVDGPATDIARGVVGTIDHFQSGARGAVRPSLRRLEGRYVGLFGAVDLVASGEGFTSGEPTCWNPFEDPDRLVVVDASTLRIADQGSYGAPGERVTFELRGGTVRSARWAGGSLWPESLWPKVERRLLRRG